MGQASVRAAIHSALEAANITNVGAVYPSRQYVFEQDYYSNAAGAYTASLSGSGAVLVVNIGSNDQRNRLMISGRTQPFDMNVHRVVLEVFFRNISGDPAAAQSDYDDLVDSLVPFIRNNPTITAPQAIWSAGEFKAGVNHKQSDPFTREDGPAVFIIGHVTFEAWEQINGTGA